MSFFDSLLNIAESTITIAKEASENIEKGIKKNFERDASKETIESIHTKLVEMGVDLVPDEEIKKWRKNSIIENNSYFSENNSFYYYVDEYGMDTVMYSVICNRGWVKNLPILYKRNNKNIFGHTANDMCLIIWHSVTNQLAPGWEDNQRMDVDIPYHKLCLSYKSEFERLQNGYLRALADNDPSFKDIYIKEREKAHKPANKCQ